MINTTLPANVLSIKLLHVLTDQQFSKVHFGTMSFPKQNYKPLNMLNITTTNKYKTVHVHIQIHSILFTNTY